MRQFTPHRTFPVGTHAMASQVENLVGAYCHFDELFSSRVVRRATIPWLFKRAPEPNDLLQLQMGSVLDRELP